jgi:protein-tyrosine kinase
MSLVERALKKMQQSAKDGSLPRAPVDLPKNAVFGTVVVTAQQREVARGESVRPIKAPERIIQIDQVALRAAGLLPPEHQERQIAQQYRQIKRPLVANAFGLDGVERIPEGHVIMMASAMPGEGKTFTSINLAFSLALERDVSVLLVDADVAKPHISRLFGLESEQGLLDLLQDDSLSAESLILPTNVPRLSVLPAGRRSNEATELLASSRMKELMKEVARNDASRITLLDSPPLLLTTESQALAQIAGQVVVVVRAGITPHGVLQDALSYFNEDKCVALILNQSVETAPAGYYYYGYSDQPNKERE